MLGPMGETAVRVGWGSSEAQGPAWLVGVYRGAVCDPVDPEPRTLACGPNFVFLYTKSIFHIFNWQGEKEKKNIL